jgi:hypothetical protein
MIGVMTPSMPNAQGKRPAAVGHPEAPPIIGAVTNTISPGYRMGIVIGAVPGVIIIARAIYDGPSAYIRSHVARGIAHIDHFRRGVINVDILDVIHGRTGRNILNLVRHCVADDPGTCRLGRREPDPIVHGIIPPFRLNHRGR